MLNLRLYAATFSYSPKNVATLFFIIQEGNDLFNRENAKPRANEQKLTSRQLQSARGGIPSYNSLRRASTQLHCTFFNGSNSTRQRSHTSSMSQGGVFQGRNTRTRSRNSIKTSRSTIWEEEDPKCSLINTASRLSEEMARSQKASYLATTLTLNL